MTKTASTFPSLFTKGKILTEEEFNIKLEEVRADERRKIADEFRATGNRQKELAACFHSLGDDSAYRLANARAAIAYEFALILENKT